MAAIDTSVDLIVWGSIDGGTTWFQIGTTVQALVDGTGYVEASGMQLDKLKCELDAEAGGVAVTVTFKYMGRVE